MTSSTMTLDIKMTAAMAPNARMIVYYVRADAEIIADSVQFTVEGVFENQVLRDTGEFPEQKMYLLTLQFFICKSLSSTQHFALFDDMK